MEPADDDAGSEALRADAVGRPGRPQTGPTQTGPTQTVVDRLEVRVARGARVLIFADLHLGHASTPTSRQLESELAAAIDAIPDDGVVVLNGDCFELLRHGQYTVAPILAAHQTLVAAIRRFLDTPHHERSFVVTTGVHDSRIAWDEAASAVIRRELGCRIALAVDLVCDTAGGPRVVRVEHGHRFDPNSAFLEPRNPLDSPLTHHFVQQIVPELAGRSSDAIDDIASLPNMADLSRYLGSRIVYRQLLHRSWVLAVPFLLVLAVRTPLLGGWVRRFSTGSALEIGALLAGGVTLDLLALGVIAVLTVRRVFGSIAATRVGGMNHGPNDPPRAAGEALCGQGFAGYVTGHTHEPELTSMGRGFYANAGCGGPVLVQHPARFGLPPIFRTVLRRSWIGLAVEHDLRATLFLAETPIATLTVIERLVLHRVDGRPASPQAVAATEIGSSWPIESRRIGTGGRRLRTRRIAAGLVFATAVLNVVSSLTPPLRTRLRAVLNQVPVELPQAASAALVFGSLALVLLSRGLRRGHRTAWVMAVGILALNASLNVLKGGDVEEAMIGVVVAVWLARNRWAFEVRTSPGTIRRVVTVAVLGPLVAIGTSLGLVFLFGTKGRRGVGESIRSVTDRLIGRSDGPLAFGSPIVAPALTATGIGLFVTAGWLMFSPTRPIRRTAGQRNTDRARARALLELHGGDTLSYFGLREDKDHFFTARSVVAYAVHNGVCLVSPDPIGPPEERQQVWADFTEFADRNGWTVAVMGAHQGWIGVYESAGMTSIYVGDEAIVDCASFSLDGGAMKGLRQAYNRMKKYGFTCSFHDPADLDEATRAELLALMTETRRGGVERGFSMTLSRIFDPADRGLLIAIARYADGRPAAFCQYVPAADIDGYSLDLMRRRVDPEMPNGITDFVVIETIKHLHEIRKWGLGLNFAVMRAVLAGELDDRPFPELERRVLSKFSESMQIESLWKYNEKFRPYWRARYLVVDALENLPAQGLAVADAESIFELPVIGRFLRPDEPIHA